MSFSIMTIGKPGGCKSTTNSRVLYELTRGIGESPILVSDRLLLEQAVLRDVHYDNPELRQFRAGDRALEGENSILYDGSKPPGHKVFEIKRPYLLNKIHDDMARLAWTHDSSAGMLFEYATGVDVVRQDEILDQSGDSLVRRFAKLAKEIPRKNKILVIEVDASFEERLRRNGDRVDGMRPETFEKFFSDGGELKFSGKTKFREVEIEFHYVNNDYNDLDRFLKEIEDMNVSLIRPIGESIVSGMDNEGQGNGAEQHRSSTLRRDRR